MINDVMRGNEPIKIFQERVKSIGHYLILSDKWKVRNTKRVEYQASGSNLQGCFYYLILEAQSHHRFPWFVITFSSLNC